MKAILISILWLPFIATGQTVTKPEVKPAKRWPVEVFAEAGFLHEFWTLSYNLSYGYSAMSYIGEGGYFGGGFRSLTGGKRVVGYGLSVNYLKYQMEKGLVKEQSLPREYSFMKVSPMVYLNIDTKSPYHFQLCGVANVMTPLIKSEHTYLQYGAKVSVNNDAYEGSAGISFGKGNGPDAGITSNWREQVFTVGVACYPGRIPFIKQKAKVKK